MRVSTRTRYGLRAMIELALAYNQGPVSVREIAAKQGLSVKYLEQLFSALKTAGLVHAVRGAGGGYTLARTPDQVKLSEIFRVLEGGFAPVDCVEEGQVCIHEDECATRDMWLELTRVVTEVLDHNTLADLAENSRRKCAPGS